MGAEFAIEIASPFVKMKIQKIHNSMQTKFFFFLNKLQVNETT